MAFSRMSLAVADAAVDELGTATPSMALRDQSLMKSSAGISQRHLRQSLFFALYILFFFHFIRHSTIAE